MSFDFFDWKDLVIIFNIVFFTNVLKYFIKYKHIYIYLPFIFSIFVFFILFWFKVYSLQDAVFLIFKWFAGSIMLYETILEKIQKVWDAYENRNKKNT